MRTSPSPPHRESLPVVVVAPEPVAAMLLVIYAFVVVAELGAMFHMLLVLAHRTVCRMPRVDPNDHASEADDENQYPDDVTNFLVHDTFSLFCLLTKW